MNWVFQEWLSRIPRRRESSVVKWAEENMRLVGSPLGEKFRSSVTPWTREPLECAADGTRMVTFVKPVQSGGSVVGEIAICYWLANEQGGDVQYIWQNDDQSAARWDQRMERNLSGCKPVVDRMPGGTTDRLKWKKGTVMFPHANFIMEGAYTDRNVASKSVRFQVNEELHDAERGWDPGKLQQAWNRTTAYWNSVIFNISNASQKGDQLHRAFLDGTQEHWEVLCLGCGQFHRMRTRWDAKHEELGGLRYDAEGSRLENGEYDYQRLAETVRYQMPCGWQFKDDLKIRRKLSLSGRYSSPENPGASRLHRSFTLEAVAVDYIAWLKLIEEKHRGLRALKLGDPKPWWDYLRERECQFVDPEDRPLIANIVTSKDVRKSREGLPNRKERYGALDRQQGNLDKGEIPHWWGLIQDVEELPGGKIHILTVWEGKLLTDDNAAAIMNNHGVDPAKVVCDSGDDTSHVYQFCLLHGFNATTETGESRFAHTVIDGATKRTTYHIYSKPTLLCDAARAPRTHQRMNDEPRYWHWSHDGIRERLTWLMASSDVKYEIPEDVSEDFKKHFNAERLESHKNPRTGQPTLEWHRRGRNDLWVCACYNAGYMEIDGIIGEMPERKQAG